MSATLTAKRARGHERGAKRRSANTRPRTLPDVRKHVNDSAIRLGRFARNMKRPDLAALAGMLTAIRRAIQVEPGEPLETAITVVADLFWDRHHAALVHTGRADFDRHWKRRQLIAETIRTMVNAPVSEPAPTTPPALERPAPVRAGWLQRLIDDAVNAPPSIIEQEPPCED